MQAAFIFVIAVGLVSSQSNEKDDAIKNIFSTPRGTNFDDLYVEQTTKPPESLGAIDKCGEGADQGVHICVPYYMCDGTTNTVIQTGRTDGFGIIDIRFGVNKCPHHLDVCCKVPPEGLPEEPGMKEPGGDGTGPEVPTFSSTEPTVTVPVTQPPPAKCGIRNINGIDFKITGNMDNEAEYGEFPWMMAIIDKQPTTDRVLICGGSLIAPNVVLTGAHCVYKYKTYQLKVRAGEWDTQTEKERLPYQERDVYNIVLHKDFNQNTLKNDFALLILESPFERAEHIGTVCLPEQNEIISSRNCFASGWGKDVFGQEGKYEVILKKIELPIVLPGPCQNALRTTRLGSHFILDKSFICAGGEAGKDTCTGDGGSPLVCPDPKNPSRYVQAGIVAWGIGCGEDKIPGVYADVAKFRSWIDEQLTKLSIDKQPYQV